MRFYFHEDAESEFDMAVEYYEGSRSGLGLEFAKETRCSPTVNHQDLACREIAAILSLIAFSCRDKFESFG